MVRVGGRGGEGGANADCLGQTDIDIESLRRDSLSVGGLLGQNGHGAREGVHVLTNNVFVFFTKSMLSAVFWGPWGLLGLWGDPGARWVLQPRVYWDPVG